MNIMAGFSITAAIASFLGIIESLLWFKKKKVEQNDVQVVHEKQKQRVEDRDKHEQTVEKAAETNDLDELRRQASE